jgi:hypothetical protein
MERGLLADNENHPRNMNLDRGDLTEGLRKGDVSLLDVVPLPVSQGTSLVLFVFVPHTLRSPATRTNTSVAIPVCTAFVVCLRLPESPG